MILHEMVNGMRGDEMWKRMHVRRIEEGLKVLYAHKLAYNVMDDWWTLY
jgi:hypothetical protein